MKSPVQFDFILSLFSKKSWKISTIETLYDDPSNRKKFAVMNKVEIMAEDSRNNDMGFWEELDNFLEWGKTYRITFEEIDK